MPEATKNPGNGEVEVLLCQHLMIDKSTVLQVPSHRWSRFKRAQAYGPRVIGACDTHPTLQLHQEGLAHYLLVAASFVRGRITTAVCCLVQWERHAQLQLA